MKNTSKAKLSRMSLMRHRKAQIDPGQILIFVVVVGITAGFVYAVYKVGGQTAAEILFRDELSSISLVSDAIVNSPSCSMYMETRDVAGERQLFARRGVIDWDKVSDSLKGCVRKAGYVWNLAAEDRTDSDIKKVMEYDPILTCKTIGTRSIPVVIKRKDKFNQGWINVSIAMKDAIATVKRSALDFEATIINTGTCSSEFAVSASIINSTSDQTINFLKIETTPAIAVNNSATFRVTVPSGNLAGRSLKIEVSPKDIPSYTKIYREKL